MEVTEAPENLHPEEGSYAAFDTTLIVETSLEDGELFMTVMMPFGIVDLGDDDPLAVDLLHYDVDLADWVLAVAGNTADSPGHDGPVGDRFAVEGTEVPELSDDLGDYGVFWNTDLLRGFAWANVDHTTDFSAGLRLCPADFDGDGDVDTADLLHLLGAWGTPDGDVDGDGDTDTADLLALLGDWGECP